MVFAPSSLILTNCYLPLSEALDLQPTYREQTAGMKKNNEILDKKSVVAGKSKEMAQLGLVLPDDVKLSLNKIFSDCNFALSRQISIFPNTHEETLDQLFVTHLAQMQGPIKFDSNWIMRLDAHFIGGGRHYRNWEVADVGLMVVFRKKGRIVRSKLVFLQSKRLHASTQKFKGIDPYYRLGMGRLLVTDDEHQELIERKTITFLESCRYKAMRKGDDQHNAMEEFSKLHDIDIYYLFYNPVTIPWQIDSPVEQPPVFEHNPVGCRIIPREIMNQKISDKAENYSPTYADARVATKENFGGEDVDAGWRLEYFVNELFLSCKVGKIDDSPNFEVLLDLMGKKSSPISSAISISFDIDE
ncbi:MAG: hypothetical protein ACJAV1_000080 [Paraglaciecola sp.]